MTSVVINDLDVVSISIDEAETKPPLVVDPDAARPLAVTSQHLEPVAGWCPQETECCRGIQLGELTSGNSLKVSETPHSITFGKSLGVLAVKTPNHPAQYIVYRNAKQLGVQGRHFPAARFIPVWNPYLLFCPVSSASRVPAWAPGPKPRIAPPRNRWTRWSTSNQDRLARSAPAPR